MRYGSLIAAILLIIGGLNWGIVGFFDYNVLGHLLGNVISRIVFAIVGLAAVYEGLHFVSKPALHCATAHVVSGQVTSSGV